MSQGTTPKGDAKAAKSDNSQDSGLHYYSGGEIKELADTRVSPWLWAFWTIVLIASVGLGLSFGALGPNFPGYAHGGYKVDAGSHASLAGQQAELSQAMSAGQTANTLDLSRIPLPKGQNLDQAIQAGSDVYQTYCLGCHGPNQDGNGFNAASLNPKPRNLHDAPFMQAMSYQRITTSIHKGVPGTAMPRWENTLTDDQIKDAIAYVWSLTAPPIKSKADAASSDSTPAASSTDTPVAAPASAVPNATSASPASGENTPVAPGVGAGSNPAASTTSTITPATAPAGASPITTGAASPATH